MISAWERVQKSRNINRAKPLDYVSFLFKDIIFLKGDRLFANDNSIHCGIASFDNIPITFIACGKSHTLEENISANFGMINPEGYRKAIRIMKQAEKFNRPIITFIDTQGAYPGIGAEERGQAEAIAQLILTMQYIEVPTIVIITGEGGSGGALALGIGNKIFMLENAIYSILSPEGFSSILYNDKSNIEKNCELMKLTSFDLKELNIIDEIIYEDDNFENDYYNVFSNLKIKIKETLIELNNFSKTDLVKNRIEKFRKIGI